MPTPLFEVGNPGGPGRPKGSRSAETLFNEAIDKLAKDKNIKDVEIDLITTILLKAKNGDLKAMEMYLDRKYGKPNQTVTGPGAGGNIYNFINNLEVKEVK